MALDLPLPKQIFGHGWLTFGNGKLSKSKEVEKKEYRPVKEIFASINELEKQFSQIMKELQGEI